MPVCKDCNHVPSGRFDANGGQCKCTCHDVADLAPEMLAALEAVSNSASSYGEGDAWPEIRRAALAQARAAISRAKGETS